MEYQTKGARIGYLFSLSNHGCRFESRYKILDKMIQKDYGLIAV